jgi:hypothetical protein
MRYPHFPLTAAAVLSALVLGACGQTTGERALSGAGLGAAAGAAGSSIAGGDITTGAVIGGAAGAAAGALTTDRDRDDDDWRDRADYRDDDAYDRRYYNQHPSSRVDRYDADWR